MALVRLAASVAGARRRGRVAHRCQWLALMPWAASLTVSAMRFSRVGARLALAIQTQDRLARGGAEGIELALGLGIGGQRGAQVAGTTRSSAASYVLHDPFALAAAMAAAPAGAISPAATSRSMRSLLMRDHAPRGLRGAKSWM